MLQSSIPVKDKTRDSARRVISGLEKKAYKEQVLSNAAIPFSTKQTEYLIGFERFLKSINYRHVLECEGICDEEY